jgi:hypothetical protein
MPEQHKRPYLDDDDRVQLSRDRHRDPESVCAQIDRNVGG